MTTSAQTALIAGTNQPRTSAIESKNRALGLCGVGAAILAVGSVAINGQIPGDGTSAVKVIDFFSKHKSAVSVGSYVGMISAVLLVLFAVQLRKVLLANDTSASVFPTAALAGAILLAAGILSTACVNLSIVKAATHGFAESAQTLNVLSNNFYLVNTGGIAVLLLAAGIATVRHPILPRWLGVAAIIFGVVALAGPLGPISSPLAILWVLVVSILITLNRGLRVPQLEAAH